MHLPGIRMTGTGQFFSYRDTKSAYKWDSALMPLCQKSVLGFLTIASFPGNSISIYLPPDCIDIDWESVVIGKLVLYLIGLCATQINCSSELYFSFMP